ncbi:cGMP-dependent protein kinase-like [Ylistrum balloti]|uniref:cGMP-dependent protein kinase-like n=1 Tax=Ylistrum balloti TaxID=509963 RepID=UPI002905D352|nr:cGMP-dependent protein kinase-like [Ylistrum balloti]
MGNKESRLRIAESESDEDDEENRQDRNISGRDEKSTTVTPFKTYSQEHTPLLVEKIQHCLSSFPLAKPVLTDQLLERLASQVVVREYEAHQDVVCQGQFTGRKTNGLFIIFEGHVEVITSEGEIIAELFKGDYFGEVSVLYDVPCTATVRTKGKCHLLLLKSKVNQKLLGKVKVKMEMIDWFVTKRYIPVGATMDHERAIRRMVPVFADWSDLALKSLVLEIKPALVVLYSPGSVVAMHGDPPVSINVIIKGRVVLSDQDCATLVKVDANVSPFTIGEEGVFCGLDNQVTVITTTCCKVVPIRTEWIQNIIAQHPQEAGTAWSSIQTKWKAKVNKGATIYSKYPTNLQFEVIFQSLKQNKVFGQCTDRCLYDLCLHCQPQEFYPGTTVCTKEEYDEHLFVMILIGETELVTDPQMPSEHIFGPGDVFCRCEWMDSTGQLKALCQCLVVKLTQNDVFRVTESCPDSVLTYPPENYVP